MRLITRTAAVSAAAAAVVLSTTPYAAAGQGFEVFVDAYAGRECEIANEAGSASFVDEGEHIYVKDRRADGVGIRARVYVSGDYRGTISNLNGSGTTVHYNGSYAEGSKVTIGVYGNTGGRYCGYDSESGVA